jgi:fumarate hydratase class I
MSEIKKKRVNYSEKEGNIMTGQTLHTDKITKAVKLLCEQANYFLPQDVFEGLQQMYLAEESPLAKNLLHEIITNAYLASQTRRPMCQDTGLTVIFIDIGQEVTLIGNDLSEAINEGVKQAYDEGYLRKSIVDDPVFERKNTKTNTPAVIHTKIVPGDKVKITVAPKGGGSENMSSLKMLKPAEGVEGVVKFVVDTVSTAGANPCPPIHVGVGIGGSMEYAAFLAKKALLNKVLPVSELQKLAQKSKKAELELRIFNEIQKLGIGTQGLGGDLTAFAVSVEMHPCHIASMPVAVNINCHAARHAEIILDSTSEVAGAPSASYEIPAPVELTSGAKVKNILLPLTDSAANSLQAGDNVLLSGIIYTGRDAAHKRLMKCIETGEAMPVNLTGQVIYYVGPCPPKGEEVIGPAGPTTSGRMDAYAPVLLDRGLKGMIGKGYRSDQVLESIKKNKAIYFVATGGAGVLLAQKIKKAEIVAYEDLGPEAIYKLYVEDFPVTVAIDSHGNNYYHIGRQKYEKKEQ